ncbi:hypothetical protein [Arthrobacter sp. TMN-50]
MHSQGGPSRGGPQDKPSRPSGAPRASPRVYRRRRLVVLALALTVVGALVWAGIVLAGLIATAQDTADPVAEAGKSAGPTVATAPTDKPSPSDPACDPAQVEVSASTDAQDYAPEQNPVLTLTVTNTGGVACPVNVGTSQMEFLVTSGDDRIFSSLDCQEGAEDLNRDIPPGGTEEANFTWERNRSAPGCETVEANPTPGSYTVSVSLGGRTSEKVPFELQ